MKQALILAQGTTVELESPYLRLIPEEELDIFIQETASSECRIDTLLCANVSARLHESFYNSTNDIQYNALFTNTSYESLIQKSPLFFEIEKRNPFWGELKSSNERWGLFSLGCPDVEQGLAHWRSLLNALLPDDTITHFRFYSSNVLLQMINASTPQETAWLLGPYAYLIIPVPFSLETSWALVSNPDLERLSMVELAMEYEPRQEIWWQVSQKHLDAFQQVLETIYRRNLLVWLWEEQSDHMRSLYGDGVELKNFIDDMIEKIRNWGFATHEQQSRCLAALLPVIAAKAPAEEERRILSVAEKDPDAALRQLESLALRRKPA